MGEIEIRDSWFIKKDFAYYAQIQFLSWMIYGEIHVKG